VKAGKRRRFAFGALEQLSTIFGAITASVLSIGLFLYLLPVFWTVLSWKIPV
jgi:hypothetical protein